jgi:hypothetical protein
MELLNIITARAVWLFDINEINPRGKSIFPELFEWIEERYQFAKAPKSINDLDETKALTFSNGIFQVREEVFVDVELKLYNDGLIANSRSSTRDSEAFLESVSRAAADEFSLTFSSEIVRRKTYLSEMNVRSLRLLAGINPALAQLPAKISEAVPESVNPPFEVGGIVVSPVQSMSPQILSAFRLERKLNTSPEEHKYYSTAPLHTDDHLNVLDWFEQNIMS